MGFPVVGAGRFHSLLWKTPVEREIESELDFHLEMRVRDYVERGMAPEAARAAALARLGNLDRVRVECRRLGRLRDRDLRRAERFAELRQDLRLACRRHLASPVFASLSIVTLALALAAATVAFAACDALVFGPLLFPAPDRLVRLREIDSQGNDLAVSRLDYLDWRQSGESLVALAALLPARRGLTLPNGERVVGVEATASLFSVLGLHAARGALLSTADERRGRPHDAVVLSDRLWRRLGGDPDLLGQMLSLDGRPYRVRGVLPAAVAFPPGVDLWVPLLLDLGPARQPSRDRHDLAVVGRLRPRVGPAAAARGLARLASPATPGSGQRGGVRVTPLADWVVGEGPRVRVLLALGAALLLGLLAGCCIVNLLISRAEGRQRELALRAALGASRGRILRQLTTEGALLALLAAALALPFATAALELVRTRFAELANAAGTAGMAGRGLATSFAAARLAGLAWNDRVAGFFAVAAAAAALAVGLVPALAATRGRRPSLGRRHLRDVLVVTEIAVATTLLVGSGLTARSYLRLRTADPGFAAVSLVTAELDLTGERYPPAVRRTLSPALEARLARVPGVRAVGSTSFAPWSGKRTDPPFLVTWRPPGQPVRTLAAEWRSVSPGFFPTLGIPLLAGRLPRVDTANTPDTPEIEIAVDRTLARRWWPAGGALGERLELGNPGRPVRVVGIVGAIADVSLDTAPRPTVFLPYPRRPWRTLTLVAQAAGDPTRVARAVRREITAFDPDLPLVDVGPLARNRTAALAAPRASLLVLVLFAILALALAGIGVYDLLAAGVDERTPEIAVRMALGAPPRGVLRLVLYRGLLLAGFGLGLGLIAAAWLARFLPTILYATSPTDVLSYVIPALLLVGMALAAGLLPARRATRITPAAVLKGP
ncbi:MAG TPA: ABC transporter permease [Thermoanaerobaculia bacterium]|nr:ABC transporter permease [Thermoanaerobaculia bacterium]